MEIDFSKLIQHYEQMEKLQKAGGLRKELNPEICVQMHIEFNYPHVSIFQRMTIAHKVKYLYNQIQNIPF